MLSRKQDQSTQKRKRTQCCSCCFDCCCCYCFVNTNIWQTDNAQKMHENIQLSVAAYTESKQEPLFGYVILTCFEVEIATFKLIQRLGGGAGGAPSYTLLGFSVVSSHTTGFLSRQFTHYWVSQSSVHTLLGFSAVSSHITGFFNPQFTYYWVS